MNSGGYKKWGKIENQKKVIIKNRIENTPIS